MDQVWGRKDLVAVVAERTEMTKAKADTVVVSLLEAITEALAGGDAVRIQGFGSFEVVERAPRTGTNPVTREPIDIPGKKVVKFKPYDLLKKAAEES